MTRKKINLRGPDVHSRVYFDIPSKGYEKELENLDIDICGSWFRQQ